MGKKVESCKTESGKKVRRLIGKITDSSELRIIQRAARTRIDHLYHKKVEAENREAFENHDDEKCYVLKNGVMMHHACLVPGVVYKTEKYVGRKHKGFWCWPSGEKPIRGNQIWLTEHSAADLVEVPDDTVDDKDKMKRGEAMIAMTERIFNA